MLVVIGVGQSLRGDDGVGLVVVEEWTERFVETAQNKFIRVELCSLPGLGLLDVLSGNQMAILVDAVWGGAGIEPGSLLVINPQELESFSSQAGSAHGWGVAETLKLAETLKREDLPKRIMILGIAVNHVEIGTEMSAEVKFAIPAAVEKLEEMVETLLGEL